MHPSHAISLERKGALVHGTSSQEGLKHWSMNGILICHNTGELVNSNSVYVYIYIHARLHVTWWFLGKFLCPKRSYQLAAAPHCRPSCVQQHGPSRTRYPWDRYPPKGEGIKVALTRNPGFTHQVEVGSFFPLFTWVWDTSQVVVGFLPSTVWLRILGSNLRPLIGKGFYSNILVLSKHQPRYQRKYVITKVSNGWSMRPKVHTSFKCVILKLAQFNRLNPPKKYFFQQHRISGKFLCFHIGNELPETNSSHLKMDGLEYDCFLLGPGLFSGANS